MSATAADGRNSCTAPVIPSAEQIAEAVALLAVPWEALRQRHKRHEGFRALVGGLLRAGLGVESVEAVVAALVEATTDEDGAKRVGLVGDTARTLRDGGKADGWPKLVALLGSDGDALVLRVQQALSIETKRITEVYDYQDEAGCLLFQTVRYVNPKDFKQRRPDGKGGWLWTLAGVARVLYHLPELLAAARADVAQTVFVPEGEKDVDNLRRLGLVATCNPMGAGKWRREYNEALRGRVVCVLPDNDEPGAAHAREVARTLTGVATSVKLLELPGLPAGGDVSDWLAAGGSAAELSKRAAVAPEWQDCGDGAVPAQPATPPFPAEPPWPDPLPEEAYHGLAGEIVRTIEPASEADPAALLFQILVGFGNVIGRTAHFRAEADTHYLNEFVVLVGKTAKGRKGTSWGHVERLLLAAEEQWARERIQSGLSSGEGLIWAVRDPIMKCEKVNEGKGKAPRYEEVEADPGISDKRLLVYEPEFCNVLKQPERTGNVLSAILRQAWESRNLQTLVKHNPARSTGAHVSLIGHITADELRRYLSTTEMANGFGNRHLWVCVQRSKSLPDGGTIDAEQMGRLQGRLAEALAFARSCGVMHRDDEAREVWHSVYEKLSEGRPGLAGAMLARGEAHVMRLACLYAVLDQSPDIGAEHLLAALALWEYVEQSVRHVFGDALGDPVADELLRLLRAAPDGMTRWEMTNAFGRHQSADRIGRALSLLAQHGLARFETRQTGGRPEERWHARRR